MASETPSNTTAIMSTGRLEAFSDGVFAVAITLLILNIQTPSAQQLTDNHGSLAGALGANWAAYLSYVLSFITVGITWINHHQMFKYITRTDHTLLFLNLLLLMCITFIPFPTALLAQYIEKDQAQTASLVYGGLFTLMSIMFNAVWWYAVWRRLTDSSQHLTQYRNMALRYMPGPLLYMVATLFSFVNAWISVVMYFALAIFYAFSNMSFSRLGAVEPKQSELLSE